MFDWIPFLGGILILTWAFFAGLMALGGSDRAGLHEVARPHEQAVAAGAARSRLVSFSVMRGMQFLLALGVIAAGLWLTVQAIT